MPRITAEQREKLGAAIRSHDFLHRTLRRIEQLHRIVFHAESLDWKFVRASAEEILIADIMTRHQGGIDGVYFALRAIEDNGRDWQSAIEEYSSYIHNYYTTPLGVLIRRELLWRRFALRHPQCRRIVGHANVREVVDRATNVLTDDSPCRSARYRLQRRFSRAFRRRRHGRFRFCHHDDGSRQQPAGVHFQLAERRPGG